MHVFAKPYQNFFEEVYQNLFAETYTQIYNITLMDFMIPWKRAVFQKFMAIYTPAKTIIQVINFSFCLETKFSKSLLLWFHPTTHIDLIIELKQYVNVIFWYFISNGNPTQNEFAKNDILMLI